MRPTPVPWKFALTVFAVIASVGVFLATQQFVVKLLHDQAAHVRTVWGLLFMLLGVAGPLLPFLLFKKRAAFAQAPSARQWTIVLGVPALYLAALGLCMVASTYTRTLLIGRQGLSVLVRVSANRPARVTTIEMYGLQRELPSTQTRTDEGPEHRFEFVGYQPYLRYPPEMTISAKGTAHTAADGSVEMSLNFDAREPFRLRFDGLAAAKVTREGQPVAEHFQFQPGKHELVVTGEAR